MDYSLPGSSVNGIFQARVLEWGATAFSEVGLTWWLKNLPANAGDTGSIPRLERSPGEGNGNPFQYSCQGKWTQEIGGLQSMESRKSQTPFSD